VRPAIADAATMRSRRRGSRLIWFGLFHVTRTRINKKRTPN
jgi:hypothetical protein